MMLFSRAAGVIATPPFSIVIRRSSPYSCCALFSASTTPSVKMPASRQVAVSPFLIHKEHLP